MLRFFTRLEKTRNFVLLLFAILMVGSLVFFYTPARNTLDQSNMTHSSQTLATVGGEKITVGEVARQKETYEQYGMGRGIPAKSILEGMIGSRITRIEAAKLGLTASDREVADKIRSSNQSSDGTPFDQAVYEQNVMQRFGSIADYERSVRDEISSEKLNAYITSGVSVSDDEVLADFQRKGTKFDLSYISVNVADLVKGINPTDAELKDYFEKNKAAYYINSPQKKVKYVFLSTEKMGQKLSIPEADLKAEYDKLPADKKLAGVLGQEIVLRIPKPEEEGQVMSKAGDIIQKLKAAGDTVTEEAFAEAAKGYSQNPASAGSGGKLTGPVRENPNKPDDPYQRLLKMQPGQLSEPISYQGRIFILRRGAEVPKSFEEAKKELDVSLRNRRAYAAAAELAQKVDDSLKQTKDPLKTAQEFAAQANMSAADMVRETAYIIPGDDVPNIGISPQFEETIASLNNAGDVGEKTPIKDGFAMPMLVDSKPPRDADFDEVRSKLVDTYKTEKARNEMQQIADQIAAGVTDVASLASAASSKGLTVKEQKSYVLGSPLGEGPTASTNEALQDAIFALKQGEATKTPVKVGDAYVIAGVNKREEANMADFGKQRSSLSSQMLAQKRSQVFEDYVTALRRRYESDGKIYIYKETLEKIDAPTASDLAPDPSEASE